MPPVTDAENAPGATRASRRQQRERPASRPLRPSLTSVRRPLVSVATVLLCALLALSGYAHPVFVAAAVALAGFVLAWGWPALLGIPSRRGTSLVLAFTTAVCVLTVAFTDVDPFLQWMPAAIAVSLVMAFMHQLLRRDGRPRLTESVVGAAAGIAIIASGVSYAALPKSFGGERTLGAGLAALGVAALVDLLIGSRPLRRWLLPMAMALGGAAAVAAALLAGRPSLAVAAFIGVWVAGISHALRRLLNVLPAISTARSQLVSAAASVLVCGVVVYVIARVAIA